MIAILDNFWSAVAEVFPDAWNKPPRRSRLMHGAGIIAMGYLMDAISHARGTVEEIVPQSEFAADLKSIADDCHWTEGTWPFDDGERAWNDIQNTPRDIQRLSDYLQTRYRRNAYASPATRRAFDINQEPDRLRESYGRTTFGQSCLLARRLIEAGVHFVTVTSGGWDTHVDNFKSLKNRLLPVLDQAYSALLQDLHDRSLLANTLVVWVGDFGRTPKVNASAGRDHWATAGVACMGGGGVRMGEVVGATNPLGEFVIDSPVTPQDLAATIYHALGIPSHTWYRSQDGRPIELVPEGKPVQQLIG